jgi:hypothetical protein
MRTRMQWVGREQRFHRKERYAPGTGVVISGAVYRKLTGNIFVFAGAVRRLGLNGRMARPFVVVHSGITTMAESGLSLRSWLSVTNRAEGKGVDRGGDSARMMAWKREMRSTRREFGYAAVKMGSKMAAR